MKTTAKLMSPAFALSLAGLAPAVAQGMDGTPAANPAATAQLVAQAGLDPAEAAGMTLDELTAIIFDTPLPPAPGATDPATGISRSEAETLDIDALTAEKFDIATVDEAPAEPAPGTVPPSRGQLIAGSGLPAEAADGLSLDDLVAIHLDT